jgi:hypothetical protein
MDSPLEPNPTVSVAPERRATLEALHGPPIDPYPFPPPTPNATQLVLQAEAETIESLYTLPGTVIAYGTNVTPTTFYNLLTYRVEEVQLPVPTTFTRVAGPDPIDKVWRVAITGGPFYPHSRPYLLYINNVEVGIGREQVDKVIFLIFDRAVLPEGATIAVTDLPGSTMNATLPETLHFQP